MKVLMQGFIALPLLCSVGALAAAGSNATVDKKPAAGAAAATAATSAPKEEERPITGTVVEAAAEDKDAVLRAWLVMGSGCKQSASNIPGPVVIEKVPVDAASPNIHKARFDLSIFKLDTAALDKQKMGVSFANAKKKYAAEKKLEVTFPAECAVRVGVNPPEGKRIKNIMAKASLQSSKSPQAALNLGSTLLLGTKILDVQEVKVAAGQGHTDKDDEIILSPGKKEEQMMPLLACGEAKLVGVDFKFQGILPSEIEKAQARLGKDHKVEIAIELEDCKK